MCVFRNNESVVYYKVLNETESVNVNEYCHLLEASHKDRMVVYHRLIVKASFSYATMHNHILPGSPRNNYDTIYRIFCFTLPWVNYLPSFQILHQFEEENSLLILRRLKFILSVYLQRKRLLPMRQQRAKKMVLCYR